MNRTVFRSRASVQLWGFAENQYVKQMLIVMLRRTSFYFVHWDTFQHGLTAVNIHHTYRPIVSLAFFWLQEAHPNAL